MLSSNQKIDPTRRRPSQFKSDGSVNDNDRVEIGPTELAFQEWEGLGLTTPNLHRMREYRLDRIVQELQKRDLAGVLLFDPLNIRYATDSTNMQVWIMHNSARACFVTASGHMVLWDFHGGDHLSAHLPLVMEHARFIKGDDEINAMRCSIASTEIAMSMMQEASVAGATENDIWAILHAENIRRGGEWIECRIMSTGPRTNPWFQESGPRIVSNGELLALDTDLVGPYGICADLSRTWVIGDVDPTEEQRRLYRIAYDHMTYNMELLKPGVGYRELAEKGLRLPEEFREQRYGVMMHGVGLCDEYPSIRYPEDVKSYGYDGVMEPGVAMCVEAYIGAVGGAEGVKLEDQVIITEDGYENLTKYPFEEKLLV